MLFVVRQLAEKAFEHHMKQHFIFVDLRKAYDSILLVELCSTLKKLEETDLLVDINRLCSVFLGSCPRHSPAEVHEEDVGIW